MGKVSTNLHTGSTGLPLRSLIIGLAISSYVLASCVGSKPTPSDRTDTFCYNDSDGLESLDPAVASTRSAMWGTSQLFNGLVELDSNQNIAPCIAKSWTIDESGTVWTFSLRTDVRFHTNDCFGPSRTRSVTAEDFRYSFERICDAREKSTGFWAFRKRILGADEFHQGTKKGINGHIRGITVVNDSTFQIRLTTPFAPFLAILTMPYGYVVPREATQHYGVDFGRHPVGTGPFMFNTWKQDIELALERNTQYFKTDNTGKRLPYLQTVRVSFLRDTKNMFLEFKRNEYDFVGDIDVSFASSVIAADGGLTPSYSRFKLQTAASQSVEYYGILLDTLFPSARSTPLATQRLIRQALNYAIDRHRIVTYVLHGRGIPARYGVLPPTMPGFTDTVRGFTYDQERARRLLAEAGYPNGKGLPTLVLQLGTSPRTASVAEAVQVMWREIGVNVELRFVTLPQHLGQVRAGELAMWRTSWIGDYPDPENFLALFVSQHVPPNGPNTTRLQRTTLDSLYAKALQPSLTLSQRASLYNQMEAIVLYESPWVFMYYDIIQRLVQPNVHNFVVDGSDRLVLERVYKTPRKPAS